MQIPPSTLTKMKAGGSLGRLRFWQLSLRSLFLLLTAAGVAALFHEPIAAFGQSVWRRWFPEPLAPTPPPVVKVDPCPGCGMG
jgi:hypothetical protein